MQVFDVLHRGQKIHQNYLLEASAGTGKTFSIQNIVVRLLIESIPERPCVRIEEILVVTFTKAAVRDLKIRIRTNIEQAIMGLQEWICSGKIGEHLPDYLAAVIEKGEEEGVQALKRLQQALFSFDQASIFTIHAFCSRMLRQFSMEAHFGFTNSSGEEALSLKEAREVIQDYFRTELNARIFSPAQLEILLKRDPDQKLLLRSLQKRETWLEVPSLEQQFHAFVEAMKKIMATTSYIPQKLLEDFDAQAPFYKVRKNGEKKEVVREKIERFVRFFGTTHHSIDHFDEIVREGVVWVSALHPSLLKKKNPVLSLHYPDFYEKVAEHLGTLGEKWSDFSLLFTSLVSHCHLFLSRYYDEEEKFSPDDFLWKMQEALQRPSFLSSIQELFHAVIIDEFQDTDPIQWKIFSQLFVHPITSWKGFIYLVGDPKQSIYSFRQADIYTYLLAAEQLGPSSRFSLQVNYRSKPFLIRQLNRMFSEEHAPGWISLPRKKSSLPYHPVDSPFPDEKEGVLHFFIAEPEEGKETNLQEAEESVFFPFIAREVLHLFEEKNIEFQECAVLVRDRYQGFRLEKYLTEAGIPTLNQRRGSLTESIALESLTAIMRAVLRPKDLSCLYAALGSSLIGWTAEDLKTCQHIDSLVQLFSKLRQTLIQKNFASFYEELLSSPCTVDNLSITEFVLSQEGGVELFRELRQIGDLTLHYEHQEWKEIEDIVFFLDRFYEWDLNEDGRAKRAQDITTNGVNILTLHFSKGLEFKAVFALGILNRTPLKEEWFPLLLKEGTRVISPREMYPKEYKAYCEEIDAEKMRQLYVALTRAKDYLFVPILFGVSAEDLNIGEASPIELFLARWGSSGEDLYQRLRSEYKNEILSFLKKEKFSFSIDKKIEKVVRKKSESLESLEPPSQVAIGGTPLFITSFSSLHISKPHEILELFPKNYHSPMKTVHTLPSNHEAGLLLHKIMEEISFSLAKSWKHFGEAVSFIRPYVEGTLFEGWCEVVAEIVFNTLKTPIDPIFPGFSFAELDPQKMIREMPFLFEGELSAIVPEVSLNKGIIKGVIDLFFTYQDRYYIADWKTNWLGGEEKAYQKENLERAMDCNGYLVQAALYKEAIKKYLSLVETRPFEECFGGTVYLFLRGLNPSPSSSYGVFFI